MDENVLRNRTAEANSNYAAENQIKLLQQLHINGAVSTVLSNQDFKKEHADKSYDFFSRQLYLFCTLYDCPAHITELGFRSLVNLQYCFCVALHSYDQSLIPIISSKHFSACSFIPDAIPLGYSRRIHPNIQHLVTPRTTQPSQSTSLHVYTNPPKEKCLKLQNQDPEAVRQSFYPAHHVIPALI